MGFEYKVLSLRKSVCGISQSGQLNPGAVRVTSKIKKSVRTRPKNKERAMEHDSPLSQLDLYPLLSRTVSLTNVMTLKTKKLNNAYKA